MRYLRVTIRAAALCGLTGAAYAALLIGRAAAPRARRRWRSFISRNWARAVAVLLRVQIRTIGTVPSPPFFLVSNHLSYLDVVVLAARIDCAFVARADVERWPIVGALCRSVGVIFIDRGNRRDIPRANKKIHQALADGRGVVLFPEGSSSPGDAVLPFKPGLLEYAASAGVAVSHAALSYRTPEREGPARTAVCWWGDMTFASHLLGLLGLSEINATLKFGLTPIRDTDRKVLANKLHRAVNDAFAAIAKLEEEWSLAAR